MCLHFPPIADPVVPGIYWRDEEDWKQYDRTTTRAIIKAASQGLTSMHMDFTSKVHPKGAKYKLDLQGLQQKNTKTGQKRPVLVIPNLTLWELSVAVMTPSVVWKIIIDAFTSEAYVKHVVTQRAAKCNSVVMHVRRNPYLTSESPLVKGFLETAQNLPPDDALVRGLTCMDTEEAGTLDLAFHGTRSSSLDPILQNGMSPTHHKSTPHGDWFARQVSTAKQYSMIRESGGWNGGVKVIMFFLLVVKEVVVTERESGNVIVLSDARYELPVAEVTVQ
ncbi:unnamed protein product [Closterium sp. NIES-64]|nr:unnamed protein product [Closterium sp. NIES-64]